MKTEQEDGNVEPDGRRHAQAGYLGLKRRRAAPLLQRIQLHGKRKEAAFCSSTTQTSASSFAHMLNIKSPRRAPSKGLLRMGTCTTIGNGGNLSSFLPGESLARVSLCRFPLRLRRGSIVDARRAPLFSFFQGHVINAAISFDGESFP